MTVQTGRTLPGVAGATPVLVVHLSLVVFMAEDALEDRIVGRIDMTVIAVVPLVAMRARVDREVLCVMIPVCGTPGCCRMASLAIGREARC